MRSRLTQCARRKKRHNVSDGPQLCTRIAVRHVSAAERENSAIARVDGSPSGHEPSKLGVAGGDAHRSMRICALLLG